jgi:hypothetical protein
VEIKNRVDIDNNFDFQNITAERVEKIINTINIKKATGADNIPAKVVRQCKVTVAQQLPCFSIALLGILGIQHMFTVYSPSKLTVHTGKWIFSRSFDNLISVTMKGKVQSQQQKNISYRSYKNFDVDIFNSELIQVAFPDIENIETSEQVNNAYMQYQDSFIHIFVKMTSTSDGVQPFLKHVGFVISCDKLNTSHRSFRV